MKIIKNKTLIQKSQSTSILLISLFPCWLGAAEPDLAAQNSSHYFFGYGGGWGAAYGLSVEGGYQVNGQFDLNLGAGFNMSGPKIGLGARVFTNPDKKFSPFFGLNLVRSSSGNFSATVNDDTANYNIPVNNILHVKAGIRARFTTWNSYISFGYGLAQNKPGFEFESGSRTDSTDKLARLFAVGGYEVSATFLKRY